MSEAPFALANKTATSPQMSAIPKVLQTVNLVEGGQQNMPPYIRTKLQTSNSRAPPPPFHHNTSGPLGQVPVPSPQATVQGWELSTVEGGWGREGGQYNPRPTKPTARPPFGSVWVSGVLVFTHNTQNRHNKSLSSGTGGASRPARGTAQLDQQSPTEQG